MRFRFFNISLNFLGLTKQEQTFSTGISYD
jgi:hypothetical protein